MRHNSPQFGCKRKHSHFPSAVIVQFCLTAWLPDLITNFAKQRKQVPFSIATYRKCGTRARMFSQTLAHRNSKNEIRPRNTGIRWEERSEYGMKHSGQDKRSPKSPNVHLGGHYSLKQWVDYLPNHTYAYNTSTTQKGAINEKFWGIMWKRVKSKQFRNLFNEPC